MAVNAARRQTTHESFTNPLLTRCDAASAEGNTVEGIEQAIAAMALEIQRLQADIAEQENRLAYYRDLVMMGQPARG